MRQRGAAAPARRRARVSGLRGAAARRDITGRLMAVLPGAPTAIGSARPDEAFEPRRIREDGLLEHLASLALDVRDLGDVEGLDPPWEAAPAGMRLRNV